MIAAVRLVRLRLNQPRFLHRNLRDNDDIESTNLNENPT
jgi:hypothetical protein